MFFSLHFTSPSIDTIMERPSGFTLEELLEEDELLQECKAQNAKLTEYLSTPAVLYKLVTYVTEMPDASDSDVRKYKYPFVATEVLSCDMPALRDAVTGEPAVLKQLFSLLATPPPLPPVLAGYACKVLKSLQKQTLKAVLQAEGMPDQRTLVQQLLTHIGSDAILALLIALCIGEPPVSEPGAPAQSAMPRSELDAQSWLPHTALVPAALDALAHDDPEVVTNASSLLCALLAASSEPPECLESSPSGRARCAQLVRVCLGVDDVPNLPALDVVLHLLSRHRESPIAPVAEALLDQVEADIDRFFAAIAAPSPLPARFSRFFANDAPAYRPRGALRCKLLLLLEECLKTRTALVMPLVELGLFPIVLDLLLLPHSCNALHMRAAAILEWAISFSSSSAELVTAVRRALVADAQIATRLTVLVADYAPLPKGEGAVVGAAGKAKGKTLPCCHAFVMHISACLLSASQRESEMRELLEAECLQWAQFIAPGGALTSWEQQQSRPLGGNTPARASEDSDDDDEIDASTIKSVLAAQAAAAASRGDSDLDSGGVGDDQDDEELDDESGAHSSSYIQHFAQYLSSRNFVNQTGDDQLMTGDQLPPPSSEAWSAEFDSSSFDLELSGDSSGNSGNSSGSSGRSGIAPAASASGDAASAASTSGDSGAFAADFSGGFAADFSSSSSESQFGGFADFDTGGAAASPAASD